MIAFGRDGDIDAAALEKRLGLDRRRSEQRGDAAIAIEAEAARIEAPLLSERDALCASLHHRLRMLAAPPDDVGAVAAQARLVMRRIEGRVASEIARAAARARDARADVSRFREKSGLDRGALYPDSKLLSTGLLVVLTAVEAAASAPIFADALQGGLAEGYVMAVTLSGLNAGVGFLGGYLGLRYLTHRHRGLMLLGLAGFALSLVVGLFLNVFAALWRARSVEAAEIAAAVERGDLAFAAGEKSTFDVLFDPHHGETVVLMILGAIVLTAAFHKGFASVDDPTPDYGKLERAARAAEEDLADLTQDARDDLEEPLEEARAAIEEILAQRREAAVAMRAAYDAAAGDLVAIDRRLRALSDAKAALLRAHASQTDFPSSPPADALGVAGALVADADRALAAAQSDARAAIEGLIEALDATTARLASAPA